MHLPLLDLCLKSLSVGKHFVTYSIKILWVENRKSVLKTLEKIMLFLLFFFGPYPFPSSVKLRNKTDWNFSTWTSIISSTVNSVFLCYGVVSKAPSYKNIQTLLFIFFPWMTPSFNNLDDHLKEIKIKMKLVENDLSQENSWTSLSELWKKKVFLGYVEMFFLCRPSLSSW